MAKIENLILYEYGGENADNNRAAENCIANRAKERLT